MAKHSLPVSVPSRVQAAFVPCKKRRNSKTVRPLEIIPDRHYNVSGPSSWDWTVGRAKLRLTRNMEKGIE